MTLHLHSRFFDHYIPACFCHYIPAFFKFDQYAGITTFPLLSTITFPLFWSTTFTAFGPLHSRFLGHCIPRSCLREQLTDKYYASSMPSSVDCVCGGLLKFACARGREYAWRGSNVALHGRCAAAAAAAAAWVLKDAFDFVAAVLLLMMRQCCCCCASQEAAAAAAAVLLVTEPSSTNRHRWPASAAVCAPACVY